MLLPTLLLAGLAGPAALPTPSAPPLPTAIRPEGDESGWRQDGRPERKIWDRLEGKPAPSLSGLSDWLGTEPLDWKALRGKVVLLDLWATWCRPCRLEIPAVQALYRELGPKGLVVLGVHAPTDYEKMPAFVAEQKLTYAFAADPKSKLYGALGVQMIPSYFVVDRSGVLRVAGANPEKLGAIVRTLLGDGPAPSWPKIVEKKLYAKNDLRGKKAPAFAVEQWLTDEPDRAGKVVLIDFWATWCGPCRKAIPELNELQKRFSDDLVVIGVSDQDEKTLRDFTAKNELDYAVARDSKGRMSDAVGVEGIPHVLLISSDGVVRWQGFPLATEDPLTADVVAQVLASDPAVRARHQARASDADAGEKGDEGKGER